MLTMIDESEKIEAPVAIHRWFADGEGWAYHPSLEGQLRQLASTAKPYLQNRTELAEGSECEFGQPIPGGYVLGSQVIDGECRDKKAQERHPTVLRLVVLREAPVDSQRPVVLRALAKSEAVRAGSDTRLSVSVCQPPIELESRSEPQARDKQPEARRRSLIRVRGIVLIASLVIGVGTAIYVLSAPQQTTRNSAGTLRISKQMYERLVKWGDKGARALGRPGHETRSAMVNRFFVFLSQEELRGKLSSNHPDVQFVQRLPVRAEKQGEWTNLKVNEALKAWVSHVKAHDRARASGRSKNKPKSAKAGRLSNEEWLKQVVRKMNYREWLLSGGYQLPKEHRGESVGAPSFPWDTAPNTTVRQYVDHFTSQSESPSPWEEKAATSMVDMLRKWQVQGVTKQDALRRPWFVFHCFFQFLSRGRFTMDRTANSNVPWNDQFVVQLPASSVCEETDFENESELISKGLRPLARELDVEASSLTVTLLKRISVRLDFEQWKSRKKQLYARNKLTMPETDRSKNSRINRFAERFRTRGR